MNTHHEYTAAVIGVGKVERTGLKGGGHQIGSTHGRILTECPRTRLVAAADINAENLGHFVGNFPCTGYEDYREMLAEEKPDIVTIATYVGLHAEMIQAAAEAGARGVLCEKPYLASPADLRRVDECVARTGVKVQVAHIRRYRSAFIRAKELFLGGSVGQPLACLAGLEGWDLSEWGTHWIDMFRFFNDDLPARHVFGQARVRAFRGYGHAMEDHALAAFEMVNGVRGILDGGRGICRREADADKPAPGAPTMSLLGSEGAIYLHGEQTLEWFNRHGAHTFDAPSENHWLDWLNAHIDWLDGGSEPHTGHTSARQTMEVILAAYLSSLHGDRIDLPLTDFSMDEWPVEALARRANSGEQVLP
jgi:predicted dehydrogenase